MLNRILAAVCNFCPITANTRTLEDVRDHARRINYGCKVVIPSEHKRALEIVHGDGLSYFRGARLEHGLQ